jgi:hypothetical protein
MLPQLHPLRSCKSLSALPPLQERLSLQPSYKNAPILREYLLPLAFFAAVQRDAISRLEAGAEVLADSLQQMLQMRFAAPLVRRGSFYSLLQVSTFTALQIA